MSKTVFVLLHKMFSDQIEERLKDHCRILYRDTNEPITTTLEKAKQSNIIVSDLLTWQTLGKTTIEGTSKTVSQTILDASSKLELFATTSVGTDHLDLSYMKSKGIQVTNAPGVSGYAVAEWAVCLAIMACKRLEEARRAWIDGEWKNGFTWMLGQDIRGSTVGIVGLGTIGGLIARTMRAMGISRLLYTSRSRKLDKEQTLGAEYLNFDEILQQSDIVFACVPLTDQTKKMFNARAFELMKKTAVFVNISRGLIVDQEDLIRALKDETIFAAGLDTVYPEPLPAGHELTKLKNCVLMPHIGSSTINARRALVDLSLDNILAFLGRKQLLNPV